MPLLFSYGTLQDPAVQVATFGRRLEVTDAELMAADAYEAPADYVRVAVTLVSGASAWVYVHGPSRPPE